MIPACRAYPYAANSLVYSGRGLWFGYSIKNVHATDTALVTFHDGLATGAPVLGYVEVIAGRSENQFPSGAAVRTESGLFIEIAGGTATVVPYFLTQTRAVEGIALYDDVDVGYTPPGLLKWLTWLQENGYDLPYLTDVSPG